MAFKHGRLAEVSVNSKALSIYCDTADINIKVATANTTTFTATWETFIAGLAGATLTLAGSYDPTVTTGPASVLVALIGAAPFACIFYPAGNNAGQGTSHSGNFLLTDYKEGSKTTDKVTFAATLLLSGADTVAQL